MTRPDFDGARQSRGLRALQKRTGKLPKDIGAALSVDTQTYRRYFWGKQPLRADMIPVVAAAYGVTTTELLEAVGLADPQDLAEADDDTADEWQAPDGWDLRAELVPILVAHRARQKPRAEYVCASLRTGRTVSHTTLGDWLRDICKAAGVTVLPCHATRHSYASLLISAGVPIPEVSKALGHASPAITMRVYAHVIDAKSRRGAAAIGGVLAPKQAPRAEIGTRESV